MEIKSKVNITYGWSDDKKYCVTDSKNKKYFLRVMSLDKEKRTKILLSYMKKLSDLKLPMCTPIDYSVNSDGIYLLQSWIDGDNAESVISSFPNNKQYSLGFRSGQLLKIIHSLPVPDDHENWQKFFNRKMDHKIQIYEKYKHVYEKGHYFLEYINENRRFLENRPQSFQHGDYHLGNMIIKDDEIYIIDFDRYDFGDPWEEFNRIVFSAQASFYFASGMINGYFDNDVPSEFWTLLALYISSNQLGVVSWAVNSSENDLKKFIKQNDAVLSWYDNMQNIIPSWYCKP